MIRKLSSQVPIQIAVIVSILHFGIVCAAENDVAIQDLQKDAFWSDHPFEAVRSLETLLKRNPELALSILIKRYDGWSEPPHLDPAAGRPNERYSLAPLIKKLDNQEIEKLYELLATKDFQLTRMQSVRLDVGTRARYMPKFKYTARDEHIREVARKRGFTPRQIRRLEETLGVYPISSELIKELEDDTLWQKQPELAVKRLENLFEVHPGMGITILLKKFCRYARDKSSDPAQPRPLRTYSLVPFVEKFTRRDVEVLFNLMAVMDFELSDQQVTQFRTTVSARYPNPAAFLTHAAEYLEKYDYQPEHRNRLERQLGITLPKKEVKR